MKVTSDMLAAEVTAAIRDRRPFISGPLEGASRAPGVYVVTSYSDSIAAMVRDIGRLVTLDPATPTSARHTAQVRAAWHDAPFLEVQQSVLDSAVRRNN